MNLKLQLNSLKQADIAALFDKDVKTIQRWHAEGLPRHGEGIGCRYVWSEVRAWDLARMSQASGEVTDKNRKLNAEADLAEMERDREHGRLIPADQVEAAWADAGLRMRSRLLSLPTKVATQIQGQGLAETVAILTVEIKEALAELSGG